MSAYSPNVVLVSGLSMFTRVTPPVLMTSTEGHTSVTTDNGSRHCVRSSDLVARYMCPCCLKKVVTVDFRT